MRGLFLLSAGAFILAPGLTNAGVGLVFAAAAMTSGAVLGINGGMLHATLFILQGIFIFAIGVLMIPLGDLESQYGLVLCAMSFALVSGAFDLTVALRHALLRGRLFLFAAGGVAFFGAGLLMSSLSAETAAWRSLLSATAIGSGAMLLVFGLRRRHSRRGNLSANAAAVRDERSEVPRDVPPELFAPRPS